MKRIATCLSNSLVVLFLLCSCSAGNEKLYKETRTSLYTIVSMTVVSRSERDAAEAINKAFKELDKIEKLLNFYSEASEISAVNRDAGARPVAVSDETVEVIEKALYVAEQTGGAFDVTVGPLVKLWDFRNGVVPDEAAVKQRLPLTGYRSVVIDKAGKTVFLKKKGMQIDVGGIVKGYAADKAVDILKLSGMRAGIVTIGGEVKAFGKRPGDKPWSVGIQNPRRKGTDDELIATVSLQDQAISTSGDYEKFFVKDGVWYHHILNPETGYPAYECRSVTIVAEQAVITDGFATGIFVLGPQKGMETLKRVGLEGVIVDKNGGLHVTEGLKTRIAIFETPRKGKS